MYSVGVPSTPTIIVCNTHCNTLVCRTHYIRCAYGDMPTHQIRCAIHPSVFTVHIRQCNALDCLAIMLLRVPSFRRGQHPISLSLWPFSPLCLNDISVNNALQPTIIVRVHLKLNSKDRAIPVRCGCPYWPHRQRSLPCCCSPELPISPGFKTWPSLPFPQRLTAYEEQVYLTISKGANVPRH